MTSLSDKVSEPGAAADSGEARRFASFIVTGGIAALVNLGSRWLLSHALPYEAAVALAYLVGMTTAFLLARMFVFHASGASWLVEYGRFAVVNAFSFLVVLGVSAGMLRLVLPFVGWTWHAEEIAHLVGVVSPIVLSYYAHKHYSFGGKTRP
jgi:putative flippase GtrA